MFNPVWESIFASREWGRYPAEDLIRFVCRETAGRANLRALEIGCGPGANLSLLAERGIEFDAIDGSKTAIAQATSRLDREYPGWSGRLVTGDFCVLPDHFSGYDLVIDNEALCCNGFDESAAVIRQIHERLKPSGAFWSRTFAAGTWIGPMEGKGETRLTHASEIDRLYGSWASINVGEITRHDGNPDQIVREWIITARK